MATSQTGPRPGRSATFGDVLRASDDARLVALLRRRPDLGSPSPSTLLSLAARASSRTSLERVLAGLDAFELHVLEAVLVLDPVSGPVSPADVAHALGLDGPEGVALVGRTLDDLDAAALVWSPEAAEPDATQPAATQPAASAGPARRRPSPGLAEILGPYPAGLGPATGVSTPTTPGAVVPLPDDAPPGAAAILDALTWGPPVGVAPRSDPAARRAVGWLVDHDYLRPTDDRHVVLPREVGLALRGGRTAREVRTTPPVPGLREVPPGTVGAESASAGLEAVRLVARLVTAWQENPPGVLRSGGLGVRDLRRTATTLETDDATAAAVVELAAAAGLVEDDGDDPPSFTATPAAEDWLDDDLGDRWATLARGWWRSRRTPWLVGSRDEKGALRGALDPELWRPWVPRLRASVLDVLATLPGRGPTAGDVVEVLRWRTPRAVPPEQAVAGLLREAALLGVTGAGALSAPGLALLGGSTEDDLAAAFEAVLPAQVDEILLQGDLTGIVPGRPSGALERLVEVAADVESRGAATTVRFTAESVVRALDHGRTADDLLDDLAAHSRTPVPQPLDYLVRDAARRHGRVRVGTASSYVRAEDPALLAGLAEAPGLRHLGLVRLAPTVVAAAVPAAELQAALREHGVVSAVEGPDGRVLVPDGGRRPRAQGGGRVVVGRRRARAAAAGFGPGDHGADGGGTDGGDAQVARYALLVARLRAADRDPGRTGRDERSRRPGRGGAPDGAPDDGAAGAPVNGVRREDGERGAGAGRAASGTRRATSDGGGTTDPAEALGLLREAIADGSSVWLEVVGPAGSPARRLVRPLTLDAGRLRAQDPARDAELTVAVHRIASVAPATPAAAPHGKEDA
ncbi:helicase-associated domain-containing protein [Cellulosimicrobium marinum]|uniref:helicase-associated domain-containing protein n=1 Tax=Cellulosimicrobium marinum TaxID=1638992 RepID=UPI001E39833C|nr:helicase-associated domain-containing protein [Cellulosimicrobium marinum]MCB7136934.1 helicase-associated domain-containing protein [Cellulosimicrobium marinum]